MNPSYIVPIMLIFILLFMQQRTNSAVAKMIINNKRRKKLGEGNEMTELAKRFINRDCIVYMYNGTQILGVISEASETGIMILSPNDDVPQLINADFVMRIREHPKNKKGKKKGVVLD